MVCAKQALVDFGVPGKGFNVEVISADHQNKPQIGASIARQWIDQDGVDAIVDVPTSSVGLAVNTVCREKNKVMLNSGSGTSDLTGPQCSPNTIHWTYDTWMLAKSTGGATVKQGGDNWFFITADYVFGQTLERDTTAQVTGGRRQGAGQREIPVPRDDRLLGDAGARASIRRERARAGQRRRRHARTASSRRTSSG